MSRQGKKVGDGPFGRWSGDFKYWVVVKVEKRLVREVWRNSKKRKASSGEFTTNEKKYVVKGSLPHLRRTEGT